MRWWPARPSRPERGHAPRFAAAGLSLAIAIGAAAGQPAPGAPVAPASPADVPLGWAGADLGEARRAAWESGRPILVFATRPDCAPCDALEKMLLEDEEIAPLCEPFLRVRLDTSDPRARAALSEAQPAELPLVLLLGPAGREATRRAGLVERAWLVEQLRIVAQRHAQGPAAPHPDAAALHASLARLEDWGDVRGALQLRERLGEPAGHAPAARVTGGLLPDEATLAARFAAADGPQAVVRLARELAAAYESEGQPATALKALLLAATRLPETDSILEAHAAFLAERHALELEAIRTRLMQARIAEPRSLPLLLALARVAEARGRIYQALHALEAAATYEPDDAWTALELQRLRLLVRLRQKDRGAPTPL